MGVFCFEKIMYKILRTFYRFILVYKLQFAVFLLMLCFAIIAQGLGPVVYKTFVDRISNQEYGLLFETLLMFLGLRVLINWTEAMAYFFGDTVLIPAARDARKFIFKRVQDLDFAFHVNKSTGSLISAFKRGDGAFFELFHDLHFGLFKVLGSLIVMAVFFSRISWVMILMVSATFLVNCFVGYFLIRRNIRTRTAFNKEEDEVSAIITDNLLNYETVELFAQEQKEQERLQQKFVPWQKALWKYANSFRMIDIIIGTLANVGIFSVMLVVLNQLKQGRSTFGDVILVTSFTTQFYYQFFDLVYRMRGMAKRFADIESYFGILQNETLVLDPENPRTITSPRGEVVFQNVSFFYPDDRKSRKVLRDFNLEIKPGETIAFVGRSGAGKTTIVKLLLRFYDVTKGELMIDGTNVRDLAKQELRTLVGVVPQEPILFNNSIGFNIAYGNEKLSQKEIVRAAKMANIYDFIRRLPDGFDTYVGERGIKLSGGQKQRLAIARMLLSDPKIIIFDEATSNLDSESEQLIQDALWKIAQNRTVIIIAHRFATIRRADRIVVLENGRIKEIGTHQELMDKRGGIYQHLWRLQQEGHLEVDSRKLAE